MMVDIKNYEGLYAITEDGRVWSYRNKKFLKLQKGKTGYYKVVLSKNNTQKTYNIHRLVAIAYIDNPNDYPCINHKDENKLNNKVENLEWCTYQYNSNYGTSKDKIRQKRVGCIFSQETLQKMENAEQERAVLGPTLPEIPEMLPTEQELPVEQEVLTEQRADEQLVPPEAEACAAPEETVATEEAAPQGETAPQDETAPCEETAPPEEPAKEAQPVQAAPQKEPAHPEVQPGLPPEDKKEAEKKNKNRTEKERKGRYGKSNGADSAVRQ